MAKLEPRKFETPKAVKRAAGRISATGMGVASGARQAAVSVNEMVSGAVSGVAAFAGTAIVKRKPGHKSASVVDKRGEHRFVVPSDLDHHTVFTRDGGRIAVFERGERRSTPGSTLVLLHGITAAHEQWAPQLQDLAEHFHILAVDHRGHGSSTPGRDGFGLAPMASDLCCVLETFDVKKGVLVGHSMGGMVIMRAMVDHTDVMHERVGALGLVSTTANMAWLPALTGPAATVVTKLAARLPEVAFIPSWMWKDSDLSWLAVRLTFGADPPKGAIDQMREIVGDFGAKPFWSAGAGLLQHDVRKKLASITIPSMVTVGTRDLLTPPFMARALAMELPDSELYLLEGAGHQLMQERPDELNTLIVDLANRTEGGKRQVMPGMTERRQRHRRDRLTRERQQGGLRSLSDRLRRR